MFLSARSSVYKIGRVTSFCVGLMCSCPALCFAQEAAGAEAATPTAAPPPAGDTLSPELARRLDELDQRARITDRKLELAQEAAAQKEPKPSSIADDKGFGTTSADKSFELKIHAVLQVDARRIFGSDDALLRDKVDTFLVRRARPIVDATVLGLVDLRFTPDFGNNTVAIFDAYLDAHPAPWLRLRAGKFKPPLGLERLQADAYVPLAERALDQNLSAQRDVGAELWGDVANAALHYELAILNGNADGTFNDIDDEHAKSYAGRLFLRPFQLGELRALGDLGVGIAVSTGNEKGSNAIANGAATNTWLPTFKSVGGNTIYSFASSGTDTTQIVFAQGRHTRVNPQLYYYVGPFGLLAEWVHEYQELAKGSATGAVNNQAGHVTASFVLGGDNTYDGVKVKKAANWATKEIGALELVVRYAWLNLDDLGFTASTFASRAASVSKAKDFGVGVNWWLSRNIRVAGTWEQTTFTSGAGTTAAVANRATEKAGFARFQVSF
jgi:phosphate-selective porin OprO/OprP